MANNARTVSDLERKYNFEALLGMTKNLKMNEKSITKIENELINMLNTLIINLKDVLEDQGEISLWFYSGTPTTENEPYISWANPQEHYGDIYYDQATGYVYQYKATGWQLNTDVNLIQAMALTNVELDTETDHERKVYFVQPTPPYSSGDWWILEDGTLKICQIGKLSGEYEVNDFVVSSRYVTTVASKTGDELTVLKGTVTVISENYVSITDLATGGRTVINGANITTGTINTDNITIGNENVTLDKDGIKLKNGAKVVGENGLMNTYVFTSKDAFSMCGYMGNDPTGWFNTKVDKIGTKVLFNVPEGLNVTSAKVILYHAPVSWSWANPEGVVENHWGYGRNLKVYKSSNINSKLYAAEYGSEYQEVDTTEYSEISNALGPDGWTPSQPSASVHLTENITSIDIKNDITSGINEITVMPGNDAVQTWSGAEISKRTAFVYAIVKIDGYMSYN